MNPKSSQFPKSNVSVVHNKPVGDTGAEVYESKLGAGIGVVSKDGVAQGFAAQTPGLSHLFSGGAKAMTEEISGPNAANRAYNEASTKKVNDAASGATAKRLQDKVATRESLKKVIKIDSSK
jgi:hypothetical protein